jgi:hypothetical protein
MRVYTLISSFLLLTFATVAQTGGDLGAILDSEGKIRAGVNGSFDASGFEMRLDDTGEPVFQAANKPNSTSSVIEWGKFYNGVGAEGTFTPSNQPAIFSLAINGSDVYVGGNFKSVGGIKCNYIAKWNGVSWSALGDGTNAEVLTILVSGSNLYIGGSFTSAGTVGALRVARWDGSTWSAMGSGFTDYVKALTIFQGSLYAGGAFTMSGGTTVNRIAKWNGTSWEGLADGFTSSGARVMCLASSAYLLYAGGIFTKSGTTPLANIAQWDGTAWSSVGSGLMTGVTALLYHNMKLYAGGNFSSPAHIAQWDGTTWSGLGAGINSNVYSITTDGTNIYAAGEFTMAGGSSAIRIAKWDGANWSALSTGLSYTANSLVWDGLKLFVGGQFPLSLRSWDGSAFSTTDHKFDKPNGDVIVNSICLIGNTVYIGGTFNSVGGVAANNIAKWNGTNWSALGTGTDGTVYALATDGTNLFAGGFYYHVGGITTQSIGMWNGTSWSAVGGGIPGYVYDMIYSNGSLFVGGSFNTVNGLGVAAKMIARWDGSNWSMLGTGLNSTVYAIAVSGTDIYAGGEFTTAGGISASKIARWDGSSWSALGAGLSAAPSTIVVSGTSLYAGGSFATAGGVSVNNIARWDIMGGTWNALGTGTNGGVACLVFEGGLLYAGGAFTQAGGGATSYIAKWNGSSWSSLGATLDGTVYTIIPSLEFQGFLVGGAFISYSTESLTQRIAKFTDSDNPLPVELVSFSGRLAGNNIQLNWQTATEVDNNGFEVERKTQNSEWQKIGFEEGHGMCNSPKYYSFSDNSVTPGSKYLYRLKQIDGDGTFTYSNIIEITTSGITTFRLEQNYPNPFNPETVIRFELPVAGEIRLEVFDAHGEKVAVLTEGFQESGVHSVVFDAKGLATGVYFYTLVTGDKKITQKMVLLR